MIAAAAVFGGLLTLFPLFTTAKDAAKWQRSSSPAQVVVVGIFKGKVPHVSINY